MRQQTRKNGFAKLICGILQTSYKRGLQVYTDIIWGVLNIVGTSALVSARLNPVKQFNVVFNPKCDSDKSILHFSFFSDCKPTL